MSMQRISVQVVRASAALRSRSTVAAATSMFNSNESVLEHKWLSKLATPLHNFSLKHRDWDAPAAAAAPLGSFEDEKKNDKGVFTSKAPLQAPTKPFSYGVLPFVGAASVAEPLIGPKMTWWLSECVNVGGIKLGLPGLAAQIFFFSPIPVIQKMVAEKNTGTLPLLPYSAMCTNGILWTTYGVLLGESAIWAPNVPAAIMGGLYTAAFYKNCPDNADWLPGTKNMHVAAIAANAVGIGACATMLEPATAVNVLGLYGCGVVVVMFSGPLVAIKQVISEKSTKALPFAMTVATFVNCILWTTYGYGVLDDSYIYGPNALGLVSACVQLGLFAKYGFDKSE